MENFEMKSPETGPEELERLTHLAAANLLDAGCRELDPEARKKSLAAFKENFGIVESLLDKELN